MEPDNTKPWYLSRGVVGGVFTVLALVSGALGVQIDPATQLVMIDQTIALVGTTTALAGTAISIWGRIKARKAIG